MTSSPINVFISHTEYDRATIAIPLSERLKSPEIHTFIDDIHLKVGDSRTEELESAMDSTHIAVLILSPEYIAYKQPMKELLYFLRRHREAVQRGTNLPIIIPCFYRLTKDELLDEPRLDRQDIDGNSLYRLSEFLERLSNREPEADIPTIKGALRELLNFKGLENDSGATNDTAIDMSRKRRTLVDLLCFEIKQIVPGEQKTSDVPISPICRNFDVFSPYYEDSFDATGLVLNFEPGNGGELTQEGSLLEMVLGKSGVNSRSIGLLGIAGVGKTTILTALLRHDRVRSRFKDGIYFMSLGKSATPQNVIESLASFVKSSGGIRRAQKMLEEGTIVEAIRQFRSWFSMKDCLFLMDDIWETEKMSSSLIYRIVTSCGNGGDDKVLLTTRNKRIALRADLFFLLKPKETLGAEAHHILWRYSRIPVPMSMGSASQRKALTEILTTCNGLPLFLEVAGTAIRSLRFSSESRSGADCPYEIYAFSLPANLESLINTEVDLHERLHSTLVFSIELLEKRMSQLGFEVPLTAAEMHMRLSVMERQERVPMIMLQYLWELNSRAQTEIVAREFEQMATVATETERKADGRYEQFLHLHDSLHMFATKQARKGNVTQKAHQVLLEGYGADLDVKEGYRMWWSTVLKRDGYIHKNLCRHLLGSGRHDEIRSLLFNPEWIARVFSMSGVAQIQHDYSICIAELESQLERSKRATSSCKGAASNRDGVCIERRTIKAIELLSGVVSSTAKYIIANPNEFSFQLYGRLMGYPGRFKEISTFLDTVEKSSKGPWIKSISCALQPPSQMSKRVIALEVPAFCMVAMGDGKRFACGCEDGMIIIVNVAKCATESSWKAHNNHVGSIAINRDGTILASTSMDYRVNVWDAIRHNCLRTISTIRLFKELSTVYCLEVSKNENHIFAGFDNGVCLAWSIETGEIVVPWFRAHMTAVQCVVSLEDGSCIVTAGDDGRLRCWDAATGDEVGETFQGHHDSVESIITSPDGKEIVSGCIDGTARIWNLRDYKQVGEPFQEPRKAWVRRIAITSDGSKLAATCGVNRQVIRVWDVKTRREICRPICNHESEITGISFLPGDSSMITSSKDATVRIWELVTGNDEIYDEKHSDIVRQVCFSPDASHVVSASDDGTLRVWNCASGRQVGKAIEAHSVAIIDVAVTDDGSSILSLAEDMTIRLWDLQTGCFKNEYRRNEDKTGFDLASIQQNPESVILHVEGRRGPCSIRLRDMPIQLELPRTAVQVKLHPRKDVDRRLLRPSQCSTSCYSAHADITRVDASGTRRFWDVLWRRIDRLSLNLDARCCVPIPGSLAGQVIQLPMIVSKMNIPVLMNVKGTWIRQEQRGKGSLPNQAYLSPDGRRVSFVDAYCRVYQVSTQDMNTGPNENHFGIYREWVNNTAGEITTRLGDKVFRTAETYDGADYSKHPSIGRVLGEGTGDVAATIEFFREEDCIFVRPGISVYDLTTGAWVKHFSELNASESQASTVKRALTGDGSELNFGAMSRAEVLSVAGEPARKTHDEVGISEGNRHIRYDDGDNHEVLATFEAPVRHSAWAKSGNLFCVGLDNGRVGILKLMNAEIGGN